MSDLVSGTVIRMVNAADGYADGQIVSSFMDFVVVRVEAVTGRVDNVESTVSISRPYMYVSSADTACPGVLTGVETVKLEVRRLLREDSPFRTVLMSTGEPDRRTT